MTGDKLSGLDWTKFNRIKVIEEGEKKSVMVEGQPYFRWNSSDEFGQRLAIVQLCELGLGTREEIAEAFGVHIKSI